MVHLTFGIKLHRTLHYVTNPSVHFKQILIFFPNIIACNAHIFCIYFICSHCNVCIRTHNSYRFKAMPLFTFFKLTRVLEFQWMVLGMLVIWNETTSYWAVAHAIILHALCALLCCFWLAQVDMLKYMRQRYIICYGAAIRLTQCPRGKLAR